MTTTINHLPIFKGGVRVLMLAGRHKDGIENQRRIVRVSNDAKQFNKVFESLIAQLQPGERIYGSLAPRSVPKAIRMFRERQLASEYDQDPTLFYRNLETRWISCLMSPTAVEREEKLWLFDADTNEETVWAETKMTYIYRYLTKNGTHYVLKPTDLSELDGEIVEKIDRNGMMLWAY